MTSFAGEDGPVVVKVQGKTVAVKDVAEVMLIGLKSRGYRAMTAPVKDATKYDVIIHAFIGDREVIA